MKPRQLFIDHKVHNGISFKSKYKSRISDPVENEELQVLEQIKMQEHQITTYEIPMFLLSFIEIPMFIIDTEKCFVSFDNALNWKDYYKLKIQSFSLTLTRSRHKVHNGVSFKHDKVEFGILFSYVYKIKLLEPENGFNDVNVIRFFTKENRSIDVRGESDEETLKWYDQCDLLWKVVYLRPIFLQKQKDCKDLIRLIHKYHCICIERYISIGKILLNLEVGERKREGWLTLIKDTDKENIEFILYTHYIVLQNYVNGQKNQVGFMILKFCYLVDNSKQTFSIHTPFYQYQFCATHETAKLEWIKLLKDYLCLSRNTMAISKYQSKDFCPPFIYTKPLHNKIFLIIENPNAIDHVYLKNSGPWSIGRSVKCHVPLKDNTRTISRTHCIIELIENIPYVLDLGSCNTRVNGKPIDICPLKPDDDIFVGDIKMTFKVSGNIFHPKS